jgi:protein-S-isoprenylcysteine O-methyltransferase Ste14
MTERRSGDHAELRRLEPPLLPLAAMAGGLLLNAVWRFPVVPDEVGTALGMIAVISGVGLSGWAVKTMQRAGVDVSPDTATAAIVESGPYGRSRNPIYLGGLLVAVGVALNVNSGWGLLLAAVAAGVLHFRVIAREERYLSSKFGEEYVAYQGRVRRWL